MALASLHATTCRVGRSRGWQSDRTCLTASYIDSSGTMEFGHSPFHISNSRWRIRSEVLLRSIRDVIIGYTTIQSGSKVQRFQWDGYDTIYDWRADGADGSQLSALHQIERTRSASQDGDGQPVRERFPERKPGPLLTGNPAPTAFSPARRKSRHRSSSSPPDAATTTAKPATEWHDPHLIAIPAVLRESRYGATPKLFLLVEPPPSTCRSSTRTPPAATSPAGKS
jgi:hypothetical protein